MSLPLNKLWRINDQFTEHIYLEDLFRETDFWNHPWIFFILIESKFELPKVK